MKRKINEENSTKLIRAHSKSDDLIVCRSVVNAFGVDCFSFRFFFLYRFLSLFRSHAVHSCQTLLISFHSLNSPYNCRGLAFFFLLVSHSILESLEFIFCSYYSKFTLAHVPSVLSWFIHHVNSIKNAHRINWTNTHTKKKKKNSIL